ncbi:unnamed protein product [Urochloa humidicola]
MFLFSEVEQHILSTTAKKEAMLTKLQYDMKALHQKIINDQQMLRQEMAEFDQEMSCYHFRPSASDNRDQGQAE